MPEPYSYTDRSKGPMIHRVICAKLAQGHSVEDVAFMCSRTVETVERVKAHPPNADFLRKAQLAIDMDNEILYRKQNEIVAASMDLNLAIAKKAIEYDEDGEPTLVMQTKKDGTQTTLVPTTLLKSLQEAPLDHDPQGRFNKKVTVNSGKASNGFGGAMLRNFKQEAISEGFIPPQVLEAEFEVVRDGTGVTSVSAADVVENTPETIG